MPQRQAGYANAKADGRRADFFERPPCRLKVALRLASERGLQAAAKNPVKRPWIIEREVQG